MLGWSLEKDNYKEETMFGVASMLCRLGVRPISTSALASRAVANFMAILVCVNYKMDEYVSTYASDPVLTLGAIKVWYELDNGLAKYTLPQLQKLILSETLDRGGVGEMVARILLLLAMDKCVLGDGVSPDYKRIGQFVFVSKFLETLGITDIPIRAKGMGDVSAKLKPAFEEWQSKWLNWYVGFTHFVRLSLEPNEDTLWYLLGRRAAGIFPRNQDGAGLIIPIFKKCSQTDSAEVQEEGFFILVQVKNRHNDDEFSQAATKKLTPLFVFGDYIEKVETRGEQTPASRTKGTKGTKGPGVNPLSHKPIQDFIRIYMNVGDDDTSHFRFLYATALEDNLDLSSNTGDENSETTSSGDAVAGSPESIGEDGAGSNDNQILGEGQRRDGGSTSLEKARQVGESTGDDSAVISGFHAVFSLDLPCYVSIPENGSVDKTRKYGGDLVESPCPC